MIQQSMVKVLTAVIELLSKTQQFPVFNDVSDHRPCSAFPTLSKYVTFPVF